MNKIVFFALTFLLSTNATMAAEDIVIGEPNTVARSATTPHPQALSRFFENALFHNVSDPIAGNPKGAVSLAEFFDYQCIHCIAMAPVISELAEKNPNLKVVFKVYSLGRPSSTRAALAAIASEKQGKFLDFHYALLTANKPLNDDVIFSIASSVGLNVAEL
ncbi:MAG TPA: DsbA family protein, partial [Myxococcota bacterium]|nr:DsbA family protein [Myxococcota bacterium]